MGSPSPGPLRFIGPPITQGHLSQVSENLSLAKSSQGRKDVARDSGEGSIVTSQTGSLQRELT